ncbi:hypothetical protein T08_9805 [Trichinella sp. T8]|nr:hypothetical protein T08_9805 [Trichinella sp. T8]
MKKSAANLSNYELSKMGIHYPYASVVGLEEIKANGEWQLMPNILPPISCLDFSSTACQTRSTGGKSSGTVSFVLLGPSESQAFYRVYYKQRDTRDNTKWLYYKRSTNREAHDVFLLRCTPHCSVHHTLTCFPLPPVALQKGKRDTQVQFRGRRHTAPLFQRSSS